MERGRGRNATGGESRTWRSLAIDVRSGEVSLGFYGFSGGRILTARVLPSKKSDICIAIT